MIKNGNTPSNLNKMNLKLLLNEYIDKREYKFKRKTKLNNFTSKDIQKENKEITRYFQNEAYNYIKDDEEVENENIAKFLKKVGIISRISYNQGKKLFKIMKERYIKFKRNKISIENENSRKKFSSK